MTAQSYLSTNYNLTMQQAKDFILANLSSPSTIFNTCKSYGVTNQMIAEIYGGVSASDVKGFFNSQGLNGYLLETQLLDEGIEASLSTWAPTIIFPGINFSTTGINYQSTATIINGTGGSDTKVLTETYPVTNPSTALPNVFIDLGAGTNTLTLKDGSSTTGRDNFMSVYNVANVTGGSGTDMVLIGRDGAGVAHSTSVNISNIGDVLGGNENDTVIYTSNTIETGSDGLYAWLNGGLNSVTMADGGFFLATDATNITGGSGDDDAWVQIHPSGTGGKLENVVFDGKGGTNTLGYKALASRDVHSGDSITFTLTNVQGIWSDPDSDTNIKFTALFTTPIESSSNGQASAKAGDVATVILADGENSIRVSNITKLIGGSGDDTISCGGTSGTWFFAKEGNDTIGSTGRGDHIVFDTALNGATNVDTLSSFVSGRDKMVLDSAIFTAFTSTGNMSSSSFTSESVPPTDSSFVNSSQHIYYNVSSGNLYYDADGSGTASSAIKFATLTGHPTISASDFLIA